MATKDIIETNKLSVGSSGMTGLYVGSNESRYAVLTDASSAKTVIYDKVTYNFVVKDMPSTIPANGGTYAVTATTSTRTHGNGEVDAPINFTPTSITIPANTGGTRTSAVTITQSYSNITDNVDFTQEADYVTNLTLTLGTPSVIPASGGSVNSVSYTMVATYKSGRNETKTSGVNISWTGVSASSKGTSISNQTTAGTLNASVTYSGVTATASKTVYQAGNWVESIEITGASATYTRISASGGTSSDSGSKGTVKYTYSSNSTGTTTPSTTYGAISSSVTYSMTNGNGFTLASTSTGNVSATSKSTTPSNVTSANTLTKSITWTWAPTSGYSAKGTKSATVTPTATVTQEANYITSVAATCGAISYATFAAGGGTAAPTNAANSYKVTYKSNSTAGTISTTYYTVNESVAYSASANNVNGFTSASTFTTDAKVTAAARGTTPGAARNGMTVTKTYGVTITPVSGKDYGNTGALESSNGKSAVPTQECNAIISVTATCGTFSYSTFTAGGGTAAPTTNGTNSYKVTYKSGSTGATVDTSIYTLATDVAYSASANNVNGFTSASTFTTDAKVTAASRGTTPGAARNGMTVTKTYTVTITPASGKDYCNTGAITHNNQKTATPSQEANYITSVVATCGDFSYATFAAAGETKAPALSADSYKVTYESNSTAATVSSTYYTVTPSVSYSASANNVNGFTSASTFTTDAKVTAASRGTVLGNERDGMTVTKTYSITITPVSGKDYGSIGAKTHSSQKTAIPQQAANYVVSVVATATTGRDSHFYYSNIAPSATTATRTGSGAGVYTFSSGKELYNASASPTFGGTASYARSNFVLSQSQNGFTAVNSSNGTLTATSLGTTISNARTSGTVTGKLVITYTHPSGINGGTVTSAEYNSTATCTQNGNYVESISVANVGLSYANIGSNGGSVNPSGSDGTVTFTFTTNATTTTTPSSTYGSLTKNASYEMTDGNGFTLDSTSTGKVSATSKGTTIGNETTSNTVTKTVCYTWTPTSSYNSKGTKTTNPCGTATATVKQSGNYVTGLTIASTTISYAAIPCGGGSSTPTGDFGVITYHFSDGSTSTTAPASTYGTLTTGVTYAMTNSGRFTLDSTSTGKVSATSKGTTIENATSSNSVTKTVTATWTPTASYNASGTKTAENTASATVTQNGNYVTAITISGCALTYPNVGAGGGTSTPSGSNGTVTYAYCSNSTSTTTPSSTYGSLSSSVTYTMTTSGTFTAINATTGVVTVGTKGTTISNATSSNTVTKTVTWTWTPTASYNASGAKTGTGDSTAKVTQNGNYVTALTVTSNPTVNYGSAVHASGGTASDSGSNGAMAKYTYSSTATGSTTPSSTYGTLSSGKTYSMTTAGTFTAIDTTNGNVTVGSKGTTISNATSSNTVTKTVTWTWTPAASYNSGGEKSVDKAVTGKASQSGNYVTALTVTTNPAVNYGSAIHASGGTATDSGSNGAMAKYTYSSTATGSTAPASTYGTLGTSKTYSMTTSGTFTAINTSNGNVTVGSKGTTFGCETTSNTVTKKITWTWTPTASYNSAGTKSTYKEVTGTAKQAMNVITGVTATCGTFSYTDFDASGGTKTPTSNANSYTVAYSSKATANSANSTYYTTNATVSYSMTNGNGFTSASTFASDAKITAASRGTTLGDERCSNTITKTYSVTITPKSGNPCGGTTAISNSKQQTGNACQAANAMVGLSVTAGTFAYSTFPAEGDFQTPSTNNPNSYAFTYTSNATGTTPPNGYTLETSVSYTLIDANGFSLFDENSGDIEAVSRGTTPGPARTSSTITKTYEVYLYYNDSEENYASDSKTTTAVQEANYITDIRAICGTFAYGSGAVPASGGNKALSTNNANSYKVTYNSNATANTVNSTYYELTESVRFSSSGGKGSVYDDGTIEVDGRGANPGGIETISVTKEYYVTVTPKSGYNYGGKDYTDLDDDDTKTATTTQEANYITSVAVTCGTFSYSTFAASGGTKTPTSNLNSYIVTYSSSDTADTVNSAYYTATPSLSYSIGSCSGFAITASTGAVKANSRGTTEGSERCCTVTKTYGVTITPVSGKDYGNTGAKSKSAQQTTSACQAKNSSTDSWNNVTINSFAYEKVLSAGYDCTTPTVSVTQTGTRTWDSGSSSSLTNSDFTYSYSTGSSQTGMSLGNANTGQVCGSDRGTTYGDERCMTIILTVNGAGNKSKTASTTCCQEQNHYTDVWYTPSFSATYSQIPASGGTSNVSITNIEQYGTRTWNSGSEDELFNDENLSCTYSVKTPQTGMSLNTTNGSVTGQNRGTTDGSARSIVVNITGTGNGGKTYTNSATCTQAHNNPSITWNNPTVSASYPIIPASGGTSTPTVTKSQTGVKRWPSTSTASTSYTPTISYSATTTQTGMSLNTSTGIVSGSTRGTVEGAARRCLSVRVRATGNGKTTDTTVSCCQEENLADNPRITNVSLDLDEFSIRDIPASGGTVNLVPPDSVYVNYYVEYTSGARSNYSDTFYYDDFENADFDGETSYSASSLGCTVRGRTKVGTVTGTLYLSKDDWYGQGEIAYSVDVYQQANQLVSTGTTERTAGSAHNYNYEISIGTSPWTNDLNGRMGIDSVDAPCYGKGEYTYNFYVYCRHQKTYEQTAATTTYTSGSICPGTWNYVEDTNNDARVDDNFSINYQCEDDGALIESSCTRDGTGQTACYLRYGPATEYVSGIQDGPVEIHVIITNEGDNSSAEFNFRLPENTCCALNEHPGCPKS